MPKNVTVQKIISVLLHRIKFILLTTIAMGMLFFLYSRFIVAPMYNTSSMIYVQNYGAAQQNSVNNKTESSKTDEELGDNEKNSKIYPADISASSNLAEICVTLFQNSDEMTSLYNDCFVDISVNTDTFFITITVDGNDPQKCTNVANQLAEKAQDVYKEKFSYGRIGVIRQAKVPEAPYSPSNIKNTLIGLLIGFVVSAIISILLELIDTTIKADDDIQEIYGIPVFAEIPDFENQG